MHSALAHNRGDHVAVAVVPITAGDDVVVVYVDDDGEQVVRARADVPYGHKVALEPLAEGEAVTEYSVQVGVARRPIEVGEHVHTHNVKTARW